MSDEPTDDESPTRRDYLKYSGAVVGGALPAGCTSQSGSDESTTSTTSTSATTTAAPTTTEQTTGEETTTTDPSYSVELAPAGEVTFDEPPEDVFTILNHHSDMVLAVGRGDDINAMHAPGYIQGLYEKFLHRLPGVSVDWEGLYSSWPPAKEKLYALDSDIHLADPAKVATAEGWSEDAIREVDEQVAPFFGNTFSDAYQEPPAQWQDDYQFYTLWEIFHRVAKVFRAEDRYEALASVHSELLDTIEGSLPPASDRPSAAMVLFSVQDDETLWGYKINQPGYYAAHTRPLGATDALVEAFGENFGQDGNQLDFEALLEADPDVLFVNGPMTEYHDLAEIRETLRNHEVASNVSAVENDRVYAQGARRQGPILNLFQTEMAAKQLYPDAFGEWPGYEDGQPYPEIPADERLFDRQRVADIVNGDLN